MVDVIVVGGGLAGLACAIHLSKFQKKVFLIEKDSYPKHKVCGEYLSNEVLPYLAFLGISPLKEGAKKITKIQLSTLKSDLVEGNLPLGGFGMSRYFLDDLLMKKARFNGVRILQDTVTSIAFRDEHFTIKTKTHGAFQGKVTIGAFGKRSLLDLKMNRQFIQKKSPYLGVKTHVSGSFAENLVALHNFKGGYCGVSKVETDAVNVCYLTDYTSFKKHKNIEDFQEQVVFKNVFLKRIFKESTPLFEKPIAIGQLCFETKSPVENHILMCGDTAGMIHPLCGNGMAMALMSAQMACQRIVQFLNRQIKQRKDLEKHYIGDWNKQFKMRIKTGHYLAKAFRSPLISQVACASLKKVPSLLPTIIRLTHGNQTKQSCAF